jgi:hypothetical protein
VSEELSLLRADSRGLTAELSCTLGLLEAADTGEELDTGEAMAMMKKMLALKKKTCRRA